jgi:hypothetical protein
LFLVFWGLGVVGFYGLALIVPVYLGMPYVFFNKVFLFIKKKKKKLNDGGFFVMHGNGLCPIHKLFVGGLKNSPTIAVFPTPSLTVLLKPIRCPGSH